jgi:hypothetical protein
VRAIGDRDGDGLKDSNEPDFVRHEARPGQVFHLGGDDQVEIRVLSVNGDTSGTAQDISLDPSVAEIDENPGSLILLVSSSDFEYLTTGDATSDDWKSEPDTEEAIVDAHAIPEGHDIDVLKVSHHGSDTSTGEVFVESVRPELAIVSSGPTRHHLPKLTTLKVLETNGALVLVTGKATNWRGRYYQSRHKYDNGYVPTSTRHKQGTITVLVAADGSKYTVESENDPDFSRTFSARDEDNQ